MSAQHVDDFRKLGLSHLLAISGLHVGMVAGLLGAVFPVCECAIVPVIRRLVKKGLPLACAITYMLSAPITWSFAAASNRTPVSWVTSKAG